MLAHILRNDTMRQHLRGFVFVQAMLKRSRRLQQFCQRPDLTARMPGYTVWSQRLGFRTASEVPLTACGCSPLPSRDWRRDGNRFCCPSTAQA